MLGLSYDPENQEKVEETPKDMKVQVRLRVLEESVDKETQSQEPAWQILRYG